ncbi:hypothetical protein HN385_06255 [archaeon]|nr:hypothetical protein [archaeon]MBT7192448.1 hypothetical protein [archaeon]
MSKSKNKANNQPDNFCEFCNDKIPRNLTNWWRRTACEKEECQEKKRLKILERSRNYQRKIPFKDVLRKSPKEILGKFNGRRCVKCNKKLREPFRFRCPTCFASVSNAFYDFDSVDSSRHKSSHLYE